MFSRGVNGEMKRTAVSHQPLHLPLVVARTALQLAPSVEPQEISGLNMERVGMTCRKSILELEQQ